jgi:putative MATE family efflux protein
MNNEYNELAAMDELPVPKAVFKNILPSIAALLMMLVYNMADMAFIGLTRDDYQIAAVTLATPIFMLLMSFGTIFGIGGTSLISRLAGQGLKDKGKNISSFCFWACIALGVVLFIFLLTAANSIVRILGAKDDSTIAYANSYLSIVSFACPLALLAGCFSNIIRAEGKPGAAMIGMVLGNVLNIILDPVFILVFKMGITGAAIATVIGQFFAGAFYIIYLLSKKTTLSLKLRDFAAKDGIAKEVLSIGVPAALGSIMMNFSQIILNQQMANYGAFAVAGIGVAIKLLIVIAILSIGVGSGIQPLIGYQVGARREKRFRETVRFSLILITAISVVITIFLYIALEPIVKIFLADPSSVEYGVRFSIIILTTAWLGCIFTVMVSVLQAMGRATAALVVNLSRNGYIYIPLLFIMRVALGMNGLAIAQPVADVFCMIPALITYRKAVKTCF